jgi:serine/threonine-protein kinase
VFTPAVAPGQGETIGNYELLGELARGGMGVVYRARQKNANRVVALKMMRSGTRASPGELQRFRAEVEAVANLDHPNIVPIYEVGEHEGQPFYTMKLVDGGSLASQIGCFRDEPRATARLLAAVAQAIHYAHQRGILHRDLKPANILLQVDDVRLRFGDKANLQSTIRNPLSVIPLVSDFGLAKRVEVESSLTQSGALIGTPSYMAPEQASRRKGAVTTSADVYGLGAILYEMLTGRPPFRADTLLDTLQQLLEQEPTPPRTLNPRADADLATICLKCLEKDPVRRYPTAQALADDLLRFAAGESIQARPVGSVKRAWRWCRRKPVAAALVATLLLVFGGGLPLVTALWMHAEHQGNLAEKNLQDAREQERQAKENLQFAREQEKKAKEQEQRTKEEAEKVNEQKKLVEENLKLAEGAVNDFYNKVEIHLVHAPGLQGLRKELDEIALNYYREFLRLRGNDPAMKAKQAEIQAHVAHMTRDTGTKTDAFEAYRKALASYEKLAAEEPNKAEYREALAMLHKEIASLHGALGQPREALAEINQTIQILEKQAAADPKSLTVKEALAGAYNNLASFVSDAGQRDEALTYFHKAIALQKELVAADPQKIQPERSLALYYGNLGNLYKRLGKPADALECYKKTHELRQKIYREDRNSPHLQLELAASYRALGGWHRFHGDKDEAFRNLQESLSILQPAVDANPVVTKLQRDLAVTLKEMAQVQRLLKKPGDAMVSLRKARATLEKIADVYTPGSPMQDELGMVYFELGIGYGNQTKRTEAIEAYEKGVAVFQKLVDAHPDSSDYHYKLGLTLHNLSTQYGPQGMYDKALPLLNQAIGNTRQALDKAPRSQTYRQLLSGHYGVFADYLRRAGRLEESVMATQERLRLWPDEAFELFRAGRDLSRTAAAVGKDKNALTAEEEKQRDRYVDQALAWLRQAVDLGYADLKTLQKDEALEPLRSREEFKKLLEDLRNKATAPQ